MMNEREHDGAWRSGFRRIAPRDDIGPGVARLYETGGSIILLFHRRGALVAYEAAAAAEWSPSLTPAEAEDLAGAGRSLPLRIERGWIWVLLDGS